MEKIIADENKSININSNTSESGKNFLKREKKMFL